MEADGGHPPLMVRPAIPHLDFKGPISREPSHPPPCYETRKGAASTFTLLGPRGYLLLGCPGGHRAV